MSILPESTCRVKSCTSNKSNRKIRQKTIEYLKRLDINDKALLTERIKELNNEWDTERVLETYSGLVILISTFLAISVSIYWIVAVVIVSFCLSQHALMGWCPPLPLIRHLGIRSPEEIEIEKFIIKAWRGDFNNISQDAAQMMDIFEKD